MSIIRAWHFTKGDKLRDGRPVPKRGEWLVHTGPRVMCKRGLHASVRLLDACNYAPGDMLHRVECDGIGPQDEDKLLCRRRRVIATLEAGDLLRWYARVMAWTLLDKWNAPDVVRRWLKTGDESLRIAASSAASSVASNAASSVASNAASSAAYSAAYGAAYGSAYSAASSVAYGAASSVASNAASSVACSAAYSAYNEELEAIVLREMGVR